MTVTRHAQILRTIPVLIAVCLVCLPTRAQDTGGGDPNLKPQANRYVFLAGQSTLVQTGGIAGVHWTYAVEGQFQLTVDFQARTAAFAQLDANAIDDSPYGRTLDPNEVFAMTTLVGTVLSDTTLQFTGQAADGSDVRITATLQADGVHLVAETAPPPNSTDFFLFNMDALAQRKYGGGSGEPNDPYQIATAADLIALGETPEDYDKHFILTADIDLDPNLPGRNIFDRAVIAPDCNDTEGLFQGTDFTGIFDGNGHIISNLWIEGAGYLGLFGQLQAGAEVRNLGLAHLNVTGTDEPVGGLAGENRGGITTCYSAGMVNGRNVGGLVGINSGSLSNSYSTSTVSGRWFIGGLVGTNSGSITTCYSAGTINAPSYWWLGGLAAENTGSITASVWDRESSGVADNCAGIALPTAAMMDPNVLGLNGLGGNPNWVLDSGQDYPRLAWEGTIGQAISEPDIDWITGSGTAEDPYLIETYDQVIMLREAGVLWNRHFLLCDDIDLDPNLPGRQVFDRAVISGFAGFFDGNGQIISNLWIEGTNYLGLFGQLQAGAEVRNLGLAHLHFRGDTRIGGLVGQNNGSITMCYSNGTVNGSRDVGGLVGINGGDLSNSHSTSEVTGLYNFGGFVGSNSGSITNSYSTGPVSGPPGFFIQGQPVGGLVGWNSGSIATSYCTGPVVGADTVGGLVGLNIGSVSNCYSRGTVFANGPAGGLVGSNVLRLVSTADILGGVNNSYSTGVVNGGVWVGGLVGDTQIGGVSHCFYDKQKQSPRLSEIQWGGVGLSTGEMQTQSVFLDAGWDFMAETDNGTEDIWWILEGQDYPRLWWELLEEDEAEFAEN